MHTHTHVHPVPPPRRKQAHAPLSVHFTLVTGGWRGPSQVEWERSKGSTVPNCRDVWATLDAGTLSTSSTPLLRHVLAAAPAIITNATYGWVSRGVLFGLDRVTRVNGASGWFPRAVALESVHADEINNV